MESGAINNYIDVAQLVLYVFWLFFAGLILYLRREDKREGYPLDSDRSNARVKVVGWPLPPKPKTFLGRDGSKWTAPMTPRQQREIKLRPAEPWPGAPFEPTGDPMLDGVGPASYAERADVPDITLENTPRIVPLRVDGSIWVAKEDPDPRGKPVVAADREVAGIVTDVWVDRSEMLIRYLEVAIDTPAGKRNVLIPSNCTKTSDKRVDVVSITSRQFANVPGLRNPDQVTRLEEDKIMGYYAGGYLYATPSRMGPLL